MSRPRHPNKEIEHSIQYAEKCGWSVRLSEGHPWGHLYCPYNARDGCRVRVMSTPRNPENHARHIWREIELCPHSPGQASAGGKGHDSK